MKFKLTQPFVSLLFAIGLACGQPMTMAQDLSFLTNGLVAFYPLNGDAKDLSGYGNDGTLVNVSVIPDRFGMPGGAAYTTGDDSYVEIPNSPQLMALEADNEITISFWGRISVGGAVGICNYNQSTDGGWEFGYNDVFGGGIGWLVNQNPWPLYTADTYYERLTAIPYTWIHLVATGSRSSQKVWFYVDGKPFLPNIYIDGQPNLGGTPVPCTIATNFHLGASGGPLYLNASPLGPDEFQVGQIDDLRIYSRALSDTEVRQLYLHEFGSLSGGTASVKLVSLGTMGCFEGYFDARSVCVDGSRLFCLEMQQSSLEASSVMMMDFTDPAEPIMHTPYPVDGGKALEVVNGMAYVATTSQVQILDVRDASAPVLKGVYSDGNTFNPHQATLRLIGNTLFLSRSAWAYGATNLIHSIDVTDPSHPVRVGVYTNLNPVGVWGARGWPLEAIGNRLYYGYQEEGDGAWGSGMGIVDASNPAQLRELGRLSLDGGWIGSIVEVDNYLYVTTVGDMGWMWAVHIADVSDPTQPLLVQRLGYVDSSLGVLTPTYMVRIGDYVYLAGYYPGSEEGAVSVLDVRNPKQPVVVTTVSGDIDFRARILATTDSRILVFDGSCTWGYRIVELPAITRQSVQNGKLNLQWNEPARGMKLQRSTSLINPDWQDMQGSQTMTSVELQLWGGPEYFRLVKPE